MRTRSPHPRPGCCRPSVAGSVSAPRGHPGARGEPVGRGLGDAPRPGSGVCSLNGKPMTGPVARARRCRPDGPESLRPSGQVRGSGRFGPVPQSTAPTLPVSTRPTARLCKTRERGGFVRVGSPGGVRAVGAVWLPGPTVGPRGRDGNSPGAQGARGPLGPPGRRCASLRHPFPAKTPTQGLSDPGEVEMPRIRVIFTSPRSASGGLQAALFNCTSAAWRPRSAG